MVIALLALLAAAPTEGAKEAYDKALAYSEAAEYDAALPYFQKAYELSNHRPSTILALAQCERQLKMYDQAIAHFKEYLALEPTPKDAPSIEVTVKLLEDLRAEELAKQEAPKVAPPKTVEAPPPPPPPTIEAPPPPPPPLVAEAQPEPESESLFESPVFWVVTGAVVVAAATGVALGVALRPEAEVYGGTTDVILESPK
jgi:tetratricopeptide (TPR) repeat protein